jgi:hypothetical protein
MIYSKTLYGINKTFIDDYLNYIIREIFNQFKFEFITNDIEQRIHTLIDTNLVKKNFIYDYKLDIKLSDKATKRDLRIDYLLNDETIEPVSCVEVYYQMTKASEIHTITIKEEELL